MKQGFKDFNRGLGVGFEQMGDLVESIINKHLNFSECKMWHAHPVWFIDGNPIVGYSKEKRGLRLMFWSGVDFEEEKLVMGTGKFKDASFFMNKIEDICEEDIERWLKKSEVIQWDYKNIVKRRGVLVRLK